MIRRLLPIRTVLEDRDWLGSLVGAPSHKVMRTLLIAAMGEALDPDELALYTQLTGRTEAPQAPCEELWILAGRRSGKSLGVACAATYLAACVDYRSVLNKGERGVLPVMAASKEQCNQIFNFLRGIFETIPRFATMTQRTPGPRGQAIIANRIRLRNRVDLEVRPASHTIRGITAVAAIAEEISIWQSDESVTPDSEILAALRPTMATTGGQLFCIGSPRARKGETWQTYKKHFGPQGHPAILVANGPTKTFNPTIKQSVIDRAYEDDAAVARSEWGGEFRSDLESYVSPEVVDECTDTGILGRAYDKSLQYFAHADPAGGSGADSFTLAVGHVADEIGILDCLIEFQPPFNPEFVVAEICGILAQYGIARVTGDRYAGGFNAETFNRHGVQYLPPMPPMTTSDYFGGFLPILNARRCRLLDNRRLQTQLCALERRPSRIGAKDQIGHPPGGHDDLCASLAGLMVRMVGTRDYTPKHFGKPFVAEQPRGVSLSQISNHPYELAASAIQPGIAHGPEYASAPCGSGDPLIAQSRVLRRLGLVR